MMNEASQYTIRILDDEYSLLSDESADQVLEVVQLVQELAQEIVEKAPNTDHKKVLALVALRFARECNIAQKKIDHVHTMQAMLIESIDQVLITTNSAKK